MFKRKLEAIGYYDQPKFDLNDENKRKQLYVWLEDQVIRHYTIEDRASLRDISSNGWLNAFDKYLNDLGCPYKWSEAAFVTDWLLSFALRLEYEDNISEKYAEHCAEREKEQNGNSAPQFVHANPLDNLDFASDDFKKGTEQLAEYLKVPLHPNHLMTLKAICKLIQSKYSTDGREQTLTGKQTKFARVAPMKLDDLNLGFASGDKILDKAMKVMRLLYINDLRQLQTAINRTIVRVQSVTANPKTDTALGKIGRG